MKNLRNTNLEEAFEYLANIKEVSPNANLYKQIVTKTELQNTISVFWVSAVACLFLVFLSTELYITSFHNQTETSDISSVIYKTNTILYNE